MKLTAIAYLLFLAAMIAGCSSEDAPQDDRPLPDGWSRIQVREGYLARDSLHSFTIDLPPGWSTAEDWPYSPPSGLIASKERDDVGQPTVLGFVIEPENPYDFAEQADDPRFSITHQVVAGQKAVVFHRESALPKTVPQLIGIYLEHIPGAPGSITAPSLEIVGTNRGDVDYQTLAQILTSVRYRALDKLPDLPEPKVSSDDWERVPARSGRALFTLKLPPGWEAIEARGLDSAPGEFIGDGISIFYEFGLSGRGPYHPGTNSEPEPPHLIWEEVIDGKTIWFVKPVSGEADERGVTGAHATATGEFIDPRGWEVDLTVRGLDGEQQELVLAILGTVLVEG